ncbi:type IX secretion system motor protein PorM/GldM [Flavobacterium hibernum]|uniref:Gliding motility protein GldM n=1 Tax=Flavobacterium hibernum TaxID=37752 RepID=A0A0D0F439_9FLAO|nr:gliding motility protein GldM [Flavobacterium hibernum]KIO52902.1 gliding motility protein GldM [Flavobacterium hibernum]OXA88543.1 gliding motility protein GldM [Flavobacterium hibernum]STO15324.1 gliding motility-associated protein GldM [Flavobacterium hibernum]
MAGGKLTPRQKMVNLMYLVFIAMLAMNMSKEVLSAFGLMNEKFESANKSSIETNAGLLTTLDQKAAEAKGEFIDAAATAHKVETISKDFYAYIETLKKDVVKGFDVEKETGKLPYEAMDKGDNVDSWFKGEGYSAKGTEIISKIEKYKADMKAALSDKKNKYATVIAEVEKKFDVSDVKNKDGVKDKYLSYHFKGFPAVASVAKLSAWQNDVQKAESDVYSAALGKAAVAAASYSNYQAIVVLDKNAYFQGEKVTGKVVLGRYDENTTPTSFQGPGQIVNGQAVISLTAGGIGEQNINGQFTFLEDGKTIPLKFKGTYVVVPKPNSATISADKMNVVYRGVVNPISVSFAGVADNKVVASAPGLVSAGKPGKYNMSPGSGNEATISVTGTLPNGDKVSDKKTFRIKGIPGPTGTIRGEPGVVKGPKSNLEVATIGAKLNDFDFEVGLDVVGFNMKIAGQPTVVVTGNKLNAQCKQVLSRAGKGDQVTISEIKTKLVGAGSYLLPRTAPVIFEIQ